ncbi:hypothetical protein, partial [Geobacillus kaustophilus]|uniref:hypothetical protein n=1 Tax=Geobacillus kaustophilus TaxID=1462 RepID=UPI001E465E17
GSVAALGVFRVIEKLTFQGAFIYFLLLRITEDTEENCGEYSERGGDVASLYGFQAKNSDGGCNCMRLSKDHEYNALSVKARCFLLKWKSR